MIKIGRFLAFAVVSLTFATQALMASPQGRRKITLDRISYATSKFWAPASAAKGLFAGEGLYLAIDPSVSES